jgi:hypothetical protein
VPAREDLATPKSWASPRSTRGAIEDMPEGAIAVADAMGILGAGAIRLATGAVAAGICGRGLVGPRYVSEGAGCLRMKGQRLQSIAICDLS